MKEFKDIPSNKRYIEYMPNQLKGNHKRIYEAFLEDNGEFSDKGPLLDDNTIKLEPRQFQQIC